MSLDRETRTCTGIVLLVSVLILCFATQVSADWLPDTRITTGDGTSLLPLNNARNLVTDRSGLIHLVWYDTQGGEDSEIYHKSFDGVTWGPKTALTANSTSSANPAAAIDSSGLLHVVWADLLDGTFEIYHRAFDGLSWTTTVAVTESSAASQSPSIAADGLGRLHLVWRDYRNGPWQIFYAMFDGLAWSEPSVISDPSGNSLFASVTCDDSQHVHVVWDDFRYGNREIHYRRFDGAAWGDETRLTDDTGISEHPMVVTDSHGNVHVFWGDNRSGGPDIYKKTFDGISWSTDERIVTAQGEAMRPSARAGDDGALHLVWYDNVASYPDIFYMEFDGSSWGVPVRLCQAVLESENPAITLDSDGNPYVVWQDNRSPYSWDIYWTARRALPAPQITSIEPGSGLECAVANITDLAGSGFFVGVEVWLQKEGEANVEATNEVVESDVRVSCDLDLSGADPGMWDVVLEDVYLQRDTLLAGFRVVPLSPLEVNSIDPDTAVAYETATITNLSGHGFIPGATVRLQMGGEEDIPATNVVVESISRISCEFELTAVRPGTWGVSIQNPDCRRGLLPFGFTVLPSLWSDDLRLTDEDAESHLSAPNARSIAMDSYNDLHVVWSDKRDGNREIYYKTFSGMAWSDDMRLTVADNGSVNPGIAIDGNDNLHVVWDDYRDSDYEIYYKHFDGSTWGPDVRLTTAGGDSRYPSIAVDGANRVYVVWEDKRGGSGTQNIYFKMHGGSAWLPDQNIASEVPGSYTPAIAVDGNNHGHVVWIQDYGADDRVFCKMFDGSAWGEAEIVTDSDRVSSPTIATDNLNQVHVAWDDMRTGKREVFYRRFNGLTWEPEERVTTTDHYSEDPAVATDDSGYVHLLWVDRPGGDDDIYYARRNSSSWEEQVRLTKAPNDTKIPSLAVGSDGELHMVWRDERDDNSEIYYKMRRSESLAGIENPLSGNHSLSRLRVVPNPVQASTQIQFTLTLKTKPVLSIYDVRGRLMRRIEAGELEHGPQRLSWDGTGNSGRRVAPGIYFLKVVAANHTASRKIIVLR